MVRLAWIFLACALLVQPAQARPSGAALAECRDESELLAALEQGIERLNGRRAVFESIYNDAFPASMSLDEVLQGAQNGTHNHACSVSRPAGLRCPTACAMRWCWCGSHVSAC